MTRRHALWLDIKRSIARSKGRFLSIVGLMALGSFALVGLFVAGPDMRATGAAYLSAHDAADLMVIGDFGLNEEDRALIERADGIASVEYGYLKDAVIDGTDTSLRIQSAPEEVSRYEVVAGRMPSAADEIALDSFMQDEYSLGDTVVFDEKPDAEGETVLTCDTFTVVGFVNSTEILGSVSFGESTAGSGELSGYAVVVPAAFDSDVYMTARLAFTDAAGLDPYTDAYADAVHEHRSELEVLLADQPGIRLAELRSEKQATIDEGQADVDAGRAELAEAEEQLDDARGQLDAAHTQIAESEQQLTDKSAAAQQQIDEGAAALAAGKDELAAGRAAIEERQREFDAARQQIAEGDAALEAARQELAAQQEAYEEGMQRRPEIEAGIASLDAATGELEDARQLVSSVPEEMLTAQLVLGVLQPKLEALFPAAPAPEDPAYGAYAELAGLVTDLSAPGADALAGSDVAALVTGRLSSAGAALSATRQELSDALAALDAAPAQLEAAQQAIDEKNAELEAAQAQAEQGARELEAARADADAADDLLVQKAGELESARATLASAQADAAAQIEAAKQEVAQREGDYQEALDAYNAERPGAEERLEEAEADLAEAREELALLEAPGYSVSTRREIPGGDSYKIYATISEIVDALARVFPVLLYFIAALVTFTTMTRMVDEERIGAGTLKALGYDDRDVMLKFVTYGLISSMLGTAIGVAAGHTLLPYIVYNAYAEKFVLPPITLLFDPAITAVAVALGLVSAVLPAWLAAHQELRDQPAALMLPKPPASGSKIWLEHLTPVWRRLSFTHKVTARNLFRYKKRMLMTIFGVAGAVILLVAGFGTQFSISGISSEQFGQIVAYDMIVATTPTATSSELAELDDALAAGDVDRTMPLHYEEVTLVAGANGDTQEITLMVPEDPDALADYIALRDRATGEPVPLDADACVLSERLAQLLGVGVGDAFTVDDETGTEHTLTCTGVCEMYMGHFVFLGADAYEAAFGEPYAANARLVTLADSSSDSVNEHAAELMELPAVRGIVQNTTLMAQIATIVESLDKIMVVLIVVATLLAAVILYNLTTINVSERIRELSTIKVLGFYDREVTMYIYRETILLTLIGVIVGWGLGVLFRNYIITVVPPDNVMFDPAFAPYVFIIPLVIVAVLTAALGVVVNRRLRNVDMLEALKSVD